jgi:8-oxo-dGTP pyrophosphatase MutT (NUDIX family)
MIYKIPESVLVVIYTPCGQVLLIRRADAGTWQSVTGSKDHPEESWLETAIREVQEETGITSEITKSIGVIDFWFMAGGKRIHKTVHHFLFTEVGGLLAPQESEVDKVSWFPLEEIVDRLAYPDEKKLIQKTAGITP